jgi:hypothetical protein
MLAAVASFEGASTRSAPGCCGKRRLWFSPKVSAYLVIAFGVDLAEVVFVQIGQANAGSKL